MTQPKPRADIVISEHPVSQKLLDITVHTEQAQKWIDQEGPKFGYLTKLDTRREYHYRVFKGYDQSEVVAWLLTLGAV